MLVENYFFIIAFFLYILSMAAYSVFYILCCKSCAKYGLWFIWLAFIFHTLSLFIRFLQAKYIPLTNQYEFAAAFAWGIGLCFLYFDCKYGIKILGTFTVPLILVIMLYAALQSKEIKPIMPALQNNWILIHVTTAIFSYGAFAIACAISAMYIIKDKFKEKPFVASSLPRFQTLAALSYRSISLGFILLTFVIISGAIWAEKAWGRYWQWDPKETWSLITWIIYIIYFHIRLTKGWNNKITAWYAIIGFISLLFSYIGVNTLLAGYHAY